MSELKSFRSDAVVIGFVVGALVCGCGSHKVTKTNHDKIKTGMTLADVEAILGPAGEDADDDLLRAVQEKSELPEEATWKKWTVPGDPDKMIAVAFVNGKAVAKAQTGF